MLSGFWLIIIIIFNVFLLMSPAKILTEIVDKQVEFTLSHAMSNTESHIIIQNTLIFMVFFLFKQCFIWRYTGKSHFTSSSGVNTRTRRKDKLVISCSLLFNFIETYILISLGFFLLFFGRKYIVNYIVKLTRLKSIRSGSNKFRNNLFA